MGKGHRAGWKKEQNKATARKKDLTPKNSDPPQPQVGHAPESQPISKSTSPKFYRGILDTSLFIGIITAAIEILIAILQWNGVEMKWIASIVLYAVPISASLWAFWGWEKTQEWSRRARIALTTAIALALIAVASIGATTQYRHDQPISSVLVITSDLTGMSYPQGTKVGGIDWKPEYGDLRLDIENSDDPTIQCRRAFKNVEI